MRSTFVSFSAWSIAVLALIGCGDDTRPPPTSTPVAIDDFCNEFVDSICDNVARCDCSPTADADCRSDLATTCGGASGVLSPTTRAHITAGTTVYDAAAAGRVIAQLRGATSCGNPIVAVGWGIDELLTFGGTLKGTKSAGAACDATGSSPIGGECLLGACTSMGGGSARCIGFAGLGATCGVDNVCVDLNMTISSLENTDFLLRCDIVSGATTGTCAALLANAAACGNPRDCASGRCEMGGCVPAVANGAMCNDSRECASGFCRMTGPAGTCVAANSVIDGGACMDDAECVSGACQADLCVPGICGLYSPAAPAPTPRP